MTHAIIFARVIDKNKHIGFLVRDLDRNVVILVHRPLTDKETEYFTNGTVELYNATCRSDNSFKGTLGSLDDSYPSYSLEQIKTVFSGS